MIYTPHIKQQTLLVDTPFLCYRSFHATNSLKNGVDETGIIYGVLLQIKKFMDVYKTTDLVFCWDGVNSKREEIYPQYKSGRGKEETPEEKETRQQAYKQFQKIQHEILPDMGFVNNFCYEGYEADDIMAQIVLNYKDYAILITADNDMFQLLHLCDMYSPSTGITYTHDLFKEEYGIDPQDWAKVKALAGCKSDNVAGLVRIGNKTAAQYLRGELKETTKAYTIIEEGEAEILKINLPLVSLPFPGCPVPELMDNEFNYEGFLKHAKHYGMETFLKGSIAMEWKELLQ